MAFCIFIYLLSALLLSCVSSSVIPSVQPAIAEWQALRDPSQITNVSSLRPSGLSRSTWSLSTSTPLAGFDAVQEEFKDLTFQPPICDGSAYGRDLRLESCQEALVAIPRDTKQILFGRRGRGRWNVNLPHRFLSSPSFYSFVGRIPTPC